MSSSGAVTSTGGALPTVTNVLGANVTLVAPAGTFYDGPAVPLTAGTWLLIGAVSLLAGSAAARTWVAKLWDGVSAPYAVATHSVPGTAAAAAETLPLSAVVTLTGPATVKISAKSTLAVADTLNVQAAEGGAGCYLLAVRIG